MTTAAQMAQWLRTGLEQSYDPNEGQSTIYDSVLGVALAGKCGGAAEASRVLQGNTGRTSFMRSLEISEALATRVEAIHREQKTVSLLIATLEGTIKS